MISSEATRQCARRYDCWFEQSIEIVEAARLAGHAVEVAHARLDERRDVWAGSGQRGEPPFDDLLLPRARRIVLWIARAARGKVAARCQDAQQLVRGLVSGLRRGSASHASKMDAENRRKRIGRNRQDVVEVAHDECALVVGESKFLTLENRAVLIAKDRNQQLVGQLGLDRVPFDVEEMGESRARAVLEDVLPPRVRGFRDAHVIRHQVEHVAHCRSCSASIQLQ